MTVTLVETNNADGGVIVRCDGVVTGEELLEINARVSSIDGQRYQLWDFTDIDYFEIDFEQIHRLAIQDVAFTKDSNLQAVVFVGSFHRLCRLVDTYESFLSAWIGRSTDFVTHMLPTLSEARAWIQANLGVRKGRPI